jgi:hypothetical protein
MSPVHVLLHAVQSECKIDRPRPGLSRLAPRPHTKALGTRLPWTISWGSMVEKKDGGKRLFGKGLREFCQESFPWRIKQTRKYDPQLSSIGPPARIEPAIQPCRKTLDHLHCRLNFGLDKNFITAWKSITKLVIFQSFIGKCCKMRIIIIALRNLQFSVILYYKREIDAPTPDWAVNFPCVIQNDWKTANFARLYYPHFTTFRNETLEYY